MTCRDVGGSPLDCRLYYSQKPIPINNICRATLQIFHIEDKSAEAFRVKGVFTGINKNERN